MMWWLNASARPSREGVERNAAGYCPGTGRPHGGPRALTVNLKSRSSTRRRGCSRRSSHRWPAHDVCVLKLSRYQPPGSATSPDAPYRRTGKLAPVPQNPEARDDRDVGAGQGRHPLPVAVGDPEDERQGPSRQVEVRGPALRGRDGGGTGHGGGSRRVRRITAHARAPNASPMIVATSAARPTRCFNERRAIALSLLLDGRCATLGRVENRVRGPYTDHHGGSTRDAR